MTFWLLRCNAKAVLKAYNQHHGEVPRTREEQKKQISLDLYKFRCGVHTAVWTRKTPRAKDGGFFSGICCYTCGRAAQGWVISNFDWFSNRSGNYTVHINRYIVDIVWGAVHKARSTVVYMLQFYVDAVLCEFHHVYIQIM